MAVASGTKLGPYEILSPLGAGGMGEVYCARDTRLERTVAIKILASHLSDHPELKQRFEREAKAISSLNHPHICTLFDVGSQDGLDFLVMEHLEGETLADRLIKGPLPFDQVLKLGMELADALAKAHRQGIIHRDLKPGNVMLTKSGAKLMDFGLAKGSPVLAAASSAGLPTAAPTSPTLPVSPITQAGVVVGTFQYMSPEQVEGKEADARSDIFALGAVLYEMLTGVRAFDGKSAFSVASAILEKEPEPISRTQPMTPPALDHVIRRALAKDPDERWQSAADIKAELRWIAEGGAGAAPVSSQRAPLGWAIVAVILAVLVIAGILAIRAYSPSAARPMVLNAQIAPPEGASFVLTEDDASGPPVLSPDGSSLAFTARDREGRLQIWVRTLSEADSRPLSGTDGGGYPFWSPDGKSLGFVAGGRLKRIALAGGPAVEICPVMRARGGSWAKDGTILVTPDTQGVIYRVSDRPGSAPVPVTKMDSARHTTHRWPYFLPGGKRFIYLASSHSSPGASASNGIYVASLDGTENRFLTPSDSNAVVAGGYLLFTQSGTLMAQAFDPASATLSGDPIAVAPDVSRNGSTWRASFDAAANGVLVYHGAVTDAGTQLQWFARDGKVLGGVGTRSKYWDLRLSRDGRKLALLAGAPAYVLFIHDLQRDVRSRVTFRATSDFTPVWSPGDKYLYFSQRDPVTRNLFCKAVAGAGDQELVYRADFDSYADDISPDGRSLLFEQRSKDSPNTIWVLPLEGEKKPYPLLPGAPTAYMARFSPDGKWVVYATFETGRPELYVTSFAHGGRWQLSSGGGWSPKWRADGKAIYYMVGVGGSIMEGLVDARGDDFQVGPQKALFRVSSATQSFWNVAFDAAPDGSRFLVNTVDIQLSKPLTLLVNWPVTLKK